MAGPPARPRSTSSRRADDGQAALVVVVVAAVFLVVFATAVASMGVTAIDRTRAQTAADSAALAALEGGDAAARTFARRHGAELLEVTIEGSDVLVVVRIGDATATARATDAP